MVPLHRIATLALVCALAATACGQKPGVAERASGTALPAGAVVDPETGQLVDPVTGEPISGADGSLTAIDGTSGSIAQGGTQVTGSADAERPGTETTRTKTTGPAAAPAGGVSTGVTDGTIKLGMHAPLTGAAPFPNRTVERGKDLYWNWMKNNGQSIFGRQVEVVLKDDQLNPSRTVAMCKEMVQKDKVFALFGFSGSDQVYACARYAASVGVPYMSGGSVEDGLDTLPNYFALWMTYEDIGRLMAELYVKKLGARNEGNGMVRYTSPLEQGAHDSFVGHMRRLGADVHYDRAISRRSNPTDAQVIAREMETQDIDNVYMLVSPIFWVQTANSAANQNYFPQWTGIASVDQLAQIGCDRNAIHNARYFNMAPAFVDADKYDPNFRKAGGEDDIQFDLWGLSKAIREFLVLPGANLTRERLIYFAERSKIETGVLPDLRFSPDDHFGGTGMHLNRADCNQRRWVTEYAFIDGF